MSDDESANSATDIAIVGMALRTPGARTVAEFWENLRGGVESIRAVSAEELIAAGETPAMLRRKGYVPRTADLDGMEMFDAGFFGFSPREAAIMDPQHRHFLECAWEAFEDAARPPESIAGPVGVFAGCGMASYFNQNVCSHQDLVDQVGLFLLRHTGNDKDFLTTRVSYIFDLRGPSVNVQTACSTSLVAAHFACQSLLSGECDMAIAGGVTIELPHRRGYLYQEGEILSPDGHCRAFDHRAAGTVFGSGVGVVVLRRLADALADGDPIRAVIKSTAINNDGASKAGYLAPSVTGQSEAIVEAHALAGISADSIQYVECHGTGTYLGDPIEVEALTQAFRQSTDKKGYCRIGSVKTNIGHLDTAAGVVGLIKAALAIEHGEIPPTLGFEKPNPAINFSGSPFVVNDRLSPWPATAGPRRAAVNSLGVGGTNAHAILEQSPRSVGAAKGAPATPSAGEPALLVLSAKNKKALDDSAVRMAEHIAANPDVPLDDVAYTLFTGRRHFEHRRVLAVADRADAVEALANLKDARRAHTHTPVELASGAVFLFPGGGAQYPHMARTLYQRDAAFKATVDEGLSFLAAPIADEIRAVWLQSIGSDPDAAQRFLRPSLQLPAILIVEVALARLWMSWGVKPAALIGHSMGENAAACVAGVLSFERAVNLVYLRGKLFDEIPSGGMLSVALDPEALKSRLPGTLDLASVNAPQLCVVSGSNAELEAFAAALAAEGVDSSRIPIDIAAHSRHIEPILERFEAFLRQSSLQAPSIPIVSNLTGGWLSAEDAQSPKYWVRHLRGTVQFAKGLALLAEDKARIYIETGPGRVLASLAKSQGPIASNQIINSLPHPDDTIDDRLHLLTSLGRAWAVGLPVKLDRMWQGSKTRRVPLPTYPFQHQHYFLERVATSERASDAAQLSKRPDIATWGWRPTWRQSLPDKRPGGDTPGNRWLVFLDDGVLGPALVTRMRREGMNVATVTRGDAFAVTSDGNYVLCPEHGREGYDLLVSHLAENGGVPERIAHFWLVTADENFRPGSSFFDRTQECGFYSLLHLAQALGDSSGQLSLQITVLTNGMQRVGEEPLSYPEKATILGPAQVIPREMPGAFVRVIDIPNVKGASARSVQQSSAEFLRRIAAKLEADASETTLVDRLWDELLAPPGNEIVALRGASRWSHDYETMALESGDAGVAKFRHKGVYLITGGLGEIATALAVRMAKRFSARLVLVGRAQLPDRKAWADYLAQYGDQDRIGKALAAIRDIEAAGGEVRYMHADIADPDSMKAVIAETKNQFGELNGVFHAAGVIRDDLIQLKSTSDVEDVFAPKVLGTRVLADALEGAPLDVVVLFSSTSADTAPAGQVDYVAANAFLNAFAESRFGRTPTQTVAIHWGVWSELGMAARAIRTARHDEPDVSVEPAKLPLFDRRVREGDRRNWLEARWQTSQQWVLDEHRLKTGQAIWPGTGYIEVIDQALRENGVDGAFEIEDLTFMRPLYVPDEEPRKVRVSVTRGQGRLDFSIDSEVQAPTGPGLLRHAEATIRPLRATSPPPCDISAIVAACGEKTIDGEGRALRTSQEDHLRFGPRWRVLRTAHFGHGQAIARLKLADEFHADLAEGMRVHPALMDIATGYALRLIPGYDPANGLWVPMSYGSIRIYGALPSEVWSWARLNEARGLGPGYGTFDFTIVDPKGRTLIVVEGFTMKQIVHGTDFDAALTNVADARPLLASKAAGSDDLSPALARLAAQVDQGILPDEGFEALLRAVGAGAPQVIVSSMDLAQLRSSALSVEAASEPTSSFERPDIDSDFVEPSTDIERALAGFWAELLGIKKIGVNDNFFDIGGHSLIAVRLFRMIKKAYSVEFPISVLLEAPTIAQCAAMIETSNGNAANAAGEATPIAAVQPRFTHVVPIHSGKRLQEPPFFICSGMFGNILNLRHLGLQIGQDRPVYGLQARGLYGDQAPHETFEEMARDYLAEVREVQPRGPYLIGGFSGGGLVAYEMAHQLNAAGEEAALVVMLDTPYPTRAQLSFNDRVAMKSQDFGRQGLGYAATWMRNRIEWERQRRRDRDATHVRSAEQFHNEDIQAAFLRAIARYQGKHYGGPVLLLRPKLKITYRLSGGRNLNHDRELVRPDNGWSPYIAALSVVEVPGNHDSMVLQPNVRVLATHLREALMRATDATTSLRMAAE
ncbi:MAG: type I polyketide synthase [Hyphomicrobium sp.]